MDKEREKYVTAIAEVINALVKVGKFCFITLKICLMDFSKGV